MGTEWLDGISFELRRPFDLSFLQAYGRAFCAFDQQDSGCLAFGMERNGVKRFVKLAGAPTVRYTGPEGRPEAQLRAAVAVYQALAHPALPRVLDHHPVPGGYLVAFEWREGACMGKQYHAQGRFFALPAAERVALFEQALAFHQAVNQRGYLAVDFYDGSILYDFERRLVTVCDVDHYRPGPFVNTMGRMYGSSRFMAPEEFILGARIDGRTNVFTLGAAAFVLLGGGLDRSAEAWQAGEPLRRAALAAVEPDPRRRYPSLDAFRAAWAQARAEAATREALG